MLFLLLIFTCAWLNQTETNQFYKEKQIPSMLIVLIFIMHFNNCVLQNCAKLFARHEHMRRFARFCYIICLIWSNNCSYLQHVIFCVENGDAHRIDAIASILISLLHEIYHFRVEMWPSRRLIHDQMSNALEPCSSEKVCTFRIKHKMGPAVEEHSSGSVNLGVL